MTEKGKVATAKFCSRLCQQGLNHRTRIDEKSGCWIWTGTNDGKHGYGILVREGRRHKAHRVNYELHKGPIAEGLYIDHLCKNPACINPDHLEAVTPRENLVRGDRIVRAQNATHCANGHPWTKQNTYRNPRSNSRVCRICTAESQHRYHKRKGL